MDAAVRLARLLMSAIFIRGGIGKLMAPSATMATFHRDHLPVVGAAYAVALLVEPASGAPILPGWRTRPAALVPAAWCIATAAVAHWHPGDNAKMTKFAKNLCMAGGFLMLWTFGPGRFRVDRR